MNMRKLSLFSLLVIANAIKEYDKNHYNTLLEKKTERLEQINLIFKETDSTSYNEYKILQNLFNKRMKCLEQDELNKWTESPEYLCKKTYMDYKEAYKNYRATKEFEKMQPLINEYNKLLVEIENIKWIIAEVI